MKPLTDSPDASTPAITRGVQRLWRAFKKDGLAECLRCKTRGALAIAVRDAPRGYQLVCVSCGYGTPWFDRKNGKIVLVGVDRFGRSIAP